MKILPTLALGLLACGYATTAPAAPAARTARVANGAEVELAASAQTPAQWTASRPKVRDLRPRARGTFD